MAQRYTHKHTAHTVQQKVNRNYRSVAPLSGSSSNCTADKAVLVQLKSIHYTNKHNIHFLNHVLP